MRAFDNIYLSWREYLIGLIKRNATEGVRFQYLIDGVEEAKKDGFSAYTEFPDINKEYKENVLDVFGQRIMKSEREDINDFLKFWEIDPKYKDDKYYLLAHTQGLNPTDNFEFLADYYPVKDLRFLTDMASLSVNKLSVESLESGDKLSYKLEPDNEYDPYAVKIFKGDLAVGYMKKIHSKVFHKTDHPMNIEVKAVEKNGAIKRAFLKVSSN